MRDLIELTAAELDMVGGGAGSVAAVVAEGTNSAAATAAGVNVLSTSDSTVPPAVNIAQVLGGTDVVTGAAH